MTIQHYEMSMESEDVECLIKEVNRAVSHVSSLSRKLAQVKITVLMPYYMKYLLLHYIRSKQDHDTIQEWQLQALFQRSAVLDISWASPNTLVYVYHHEWHGSNKPSTIEIPIYVKIKR